ncbi:hypothetical protein ABN034_29955 [Actinopolymorpha sp. B11F2]|uniref:hypothetical protein n=1 Tax=Actinopolymorpha sp. B11F2 TaxID=3160862 RepID=UPI0032E41347
MSFSRDQVVAAHPGVVEPKLRVPGPDDAHEVPPNGPHQRSTANTYKQQSTVSDVRIEG